jgi:hypothetical protein
VAIRTICLTCWICDKSIDLKNCVTDEHGIAVHQECYTVRLALENSARKGPRPYTSVAVRLRSPSSQKGGS